ncbi:hypothetical protein GGF48_004863, partial [Coemansia sp. RSA 921]
REGVCRNSHGIRRLCQYVPLQYGLGERHRIRDTRRVEKGQYSQADSLEWQQHLHAGTWRRRTSGL